jgi:anti-sigma factor RsiW
MYCVRSSEELTSFVDGELSPAQAAEFQRHLAECPACCRELSRLKQTASLVGALAEVAPPADLQARVEHKAAQPRAVTPLACVSVREMLDEYAHGELAGSTEASVLAHLGECQACSRELARLDQDVGLLRTLADVNPPARIRYKVKSAAILRSRPLHARLSVRGVVATAATAAAAAVVVLTLRAPTLTSNPTAVASRPLPGPTSAAPAPTWAAPTPAVRNGGAVARKPSPANRLDLTTARPPGATPTVGAAVRRGDRLDNGVVARYLVSGAGGGTRTMVAARPDEEATPTATPARPPIQTPAPELGAASAGPVVETEPAVSDESTPKPHPTRESVSASVMPVIEPPLSEVRQVLRTEKRSQPPTFRSKRERDRLAAGPISPWGF